MPQPSKKEEKRRGLVLTLPGAPTTPHRVGEWPGHYRPDIATPVGGDGEITIELAEQADKDKSVPLKLVDITADKVAEAERVVQEHKDEIRNAVVNLRKRSDLTAFEKEQIKETQDALKET